MSFKALLGSKTGKTISTSVRGRTVVDVNA